MLSDCNKFRESDSKKYKVLIEKNKDGYEERTVIRVEDNHIIYKYTKIHRRSPFNNFVKINDQEWWFDGRDYTLKLFVNCDTGEVYDDPLKIEETNHDWEFIWTGPCEISPNGKYMLMDGCIWGCPYEKKLYDISDLSKGYDELYIEDHLIDEDIDKDYYDYDIPLKFTSDNKIRIL